MIPRRHFLTQIALASLGATPAMARQAPKELSVPPRVATAVKQAKALQKAGKSIKALTVLEGRRKALNINITLNENRFLHNLTADIYFNLGDDAYGKNKFGESRLFFEKSLRINKIYRKREAIYDIERINLINIKLNREVEYEELINRLFIDIHDSNIKVVYCRNIGVLLGGNNNDNDSLQYLKRSVGFISKDTDLKTSIEVKIRLAYKLYTVGDMYKSKYACDELLKTVKSDDLKNFYWEIYNLLGKISGYIGQYDDCIKYYKLSLRYLEKEKNSENEAWVHYNLGKMLYFRGEGSESLIHLEKSLKIFTHLNDDRSKASVLSELGSANDVLGNQNDARRLLLRSLSINKKLGDVEGMVNNYFYLALNSEWLGDKRMANNFYQNSLSLDKNLINRANTLGCLMRLWYWDLKDLNIASIYGKMSVNIYQEIRSKISSFDQKTKDGFLNEFSDVYRTLSEILIEQGRLLEAQLVLDLRKQQELFDLLRSDVGELAGVKLAELNVIEAEADKRMREQGNKIFALAREEEAILKKNKSIRSAAEVKRLGELKKLLEEAQAQYQKVIDSLQALFASDRGRLATKEFQPKDAEAFTSTLQTLREATKKKPLAVYTLVGEKMLRFLVISDLGNPVAREYPITAADLYRKVNDFRDALLNPKIDPRPLGKELYDILIQPIKEDLDGAAAESLYWSLDGALRLIPLAALSPDGERYLIETNRAGSIFTPASGTDKLVKEPKAAWKALALGVTRSFENVENEGRSYQFDALKGVPAELDAVAKLLPGSVNLRDEKFTVENLESTLADTPGGFPVVHIASHFHFQPTGNETDSFLLMGDGKPLTLALLKNLRSSVFVGADLVTLSACATGLGTDKAPGTGAEVEGFGALAQRKGAGAVLASLWSVSDASTTALMQKFYERRQGEPNAGKAECLRLAQLAILRGDVKLDPASLGRGPLSGQSSPELGKPFIAPENAPAAHPFYWAPFVLMGNAR